MNASDADSSAAGADLAGLAADYWEQTLEASPLFATALGDRRFDHLLDDRSPEGTARIRAALAKLREATDRIPAESLDATDRVTRSALVESIAADLARIDAGLDRWEVDPLDGPQVTFNNLPAFQATRTPGEAASLVERYRAIGGWIDTAIANLRRSRDDGRVAVREPVERVLDELDELLAADPDTWSMAGAGRTDHADWSPGALERFRSDLSSALHAVVRPAFARYRDVLRSEILPVARSSGHPGLLHVPGGLDDYRRLIRHHTSLDLGAEEIHATGLREIARIDAEFVELGGRVLGTRELPETLDRLRHDAALYFSTRDEVQAKAETALARARAAIPDWFGILPAAPCVVVRMEAHEEKHSTLAYYRQPAADGSRPGQYFINTYQPETRARYEAEALAYHEAIPGHHLQLAIGQERTDLPAFRRHLGPTAYVEGWGLYTERLSDEIGLYSGDLDRFGILSFDAWRASRLVVDTGMHAFGWTRTQALEFMSQHTALAANNIANEVDRYIVWPAQALGYKIGQLELLRLRAVAEERRGAGFRIRDFHDVVLGTGALPLPTLRVLVEAYASA
ncbi:MAG TPA: DUF885 domain-containing protein [Candidatus Limnocylindrales bacterium]